MPSMDCWRRGYYGPYPPSTKEPNRLKQLLRAAITVVLVVLGVLVAVLSVIFGLISALTVMAGVLSFLTSFGVLFWGLVDRSQAEQTAASFLFLGALALWVIAAVCAGLVAALAGLAELLGIKMS